MNSALDFLFENYAFGTSLRAYCEALLSRMDVTPLLRSFFDQRRLCRFAHTTAPCSALGYFPDGFYPAEAFFSPAKQLFDQMRLPHATGFMAVYYAMLPLTQSLYRQHSVPEDIFQKTALLWLQAVKNSYQKNGCWGIEDYIELAGFFIPELYPIGSLQMRLCAFPYEDITLPCGRVRHGQPVIQVHVPTGADLSRPLLNAAYDRASALFGIRLFMADSWLLFPAHEQMLSADSSIRGFMSDYSIFRSEATYDYEGLWRVFGKRDSYQASELPTHTSLQRAYTARVAAGLPIGSGVGVFCYTGEARGTD